MQTSDVTSIVQTTLAIVALFFAYRESQKWRIELLGRKRVELAIRLGKATLEIRKAFEDARSPFSFSNQSPEYKPNSTTQEKLKQDTAHDFNQRLQKVADALHVLYEIRWEIDILFDQVIEAEIKEYNAKYHEPQIAMMKIYEGHGSEADQNIVYSTGNGEDQFTKDIDTITKRLRAFTRKYAR